MLVRDWRARLEELKRQRIHYAAIARGADAGGPAGRPSATDSPPLSPQEEWVIAQAMNARTGAPLRLLTPWLSSFGLARVLATLVQVRMGSTAPVVILAHCRLLQHHYAAFSFAGYTSVAQMYPMRRWDGENLVPKPRATKDKTAVVWVKNLDQAAEMVARFPGAPLLVWEDGYPPISTARTARLPSGFSVMLTLRSRLPGDPDGPEPGEFLAPPGTDPPMPGLPQREEDEVWAIHARRLGGVAHPVEFENERVDVDDAALRRLAEATHLLVQRNDRSSGHFWACLRLAGDLERQMTNRLRPVSDTDFLILEMLRDREHNLPIHLREPWRAWVEAYEAALRALADRVTSKAQKVIHAVLNPNFYGLILPASTEDSEAVRTMLRREGADESRVLDPEAIDWHDLLWEGTPKAFLKGVHHRDIDTLAVVGVPKRTTLEHFASGYVRRVACWTYPHEAARLRAVVRRLRRIGATRTDPEEIRSPDEFEEVTEEALAALLDFTPKPRAEAAEAEAQEEEDREEAILGMVEQRRVRVETSGGERAYAPYRQLYVFRRPSVLAVPALGLQVGDYVIEAPSLAGRSTDLVKAVLRKDARFAAVVRDAHEWRDRLIWRYRGWLKRQPGGFGSFRAFYEACLPSVDVDLQTVRQWIDESIDVPRSDNMIRLLRDLGVPSDETRKHIVAQDKYRSLRAHAHQYLRGHLARLTRARLEPSLRFEPPPTDEDGASIHDLLYAYLDDVRFIQVRSLPR